MASGETTYILKHTAQGFKLQLDKDSAQPIAEVRSDSAPLISELALARWDHWRQRKLARLWQATLLGMGYEPTQDAWRSFAVHDKAKFQRYRDRLDIAKTLIGYELDFFVDHLRESDGVGGKYVELTDYYAFAARLGWAELTSMHDGLRIETNPPTLELAPKQKNALLVLLGEVILLAHPQAASGDPAKRARATIGWLASSGSRVPVQERTLKQYFAEMENAVRAYDERNPEADS